MNLQVRLHHFEGPLGLLLHLIKEQQMDIFDIDIAQITQQYLDYIKIMKTLDLEVAGDFVAMAATLLHIKSRMLLPQYNDEGEEIEGEDPRKELVQKLLEYQKFKEAAGQLQRRPWVGRDVWLRGERVDLKDAEEGEVILEDKPLFSLIASYRKAIRSMKSGVHRVMGALQSVASRILEIKDLLPVGQRTPFRSLIQAEGEPRRAQVLVTFLCLLELAKMGFVSLFQSDTFEEIHIDAKHIIDGDVVQRVESYDSAHAAEAAQSILASAEIFVQDSELPLMSATDEEIEAEEKRLFDFDLGLGEPTGEGAT